MIRGEFIVMGIGLIATILFLQPAFGSEDKQALENDLNIARIEMVDQ